MQISTKHKYEISIYRTADILSAFWAAGILPAENCGLEVRGPICRLEACGPI
jgi:hypothetical protein